MKTFESRRGARGFTLIELMTVVSIVGILAAVTYPSYTSYVVRTQRAQAASCVNEMAQFMERVYASNVRYDQNNGAATALPSTPCRTDIASRYTLQFATSEPTERTFRIQAVPTGSQASNDGKCGTLSLTQTGAKGVTGTGTVEDCWR